MKALAGLDAVVAAAGAGSRCGADAPKQFLPLAGLVVIGHSLRTLLADTRIRAVLVACQAEHEGAVAEQVSALDASARQRVQLAACGGPTRAATVLAAARRLDSAAWLLVHDAARPCLHAEDLAAVIDAAAAAAAPALLAEPATATVKRACDGRVAETLSRDGIWLAQTPQIAPAGLLVDALASHPEATDEAQALELDGHSPVLVAARHPNPKITVAHDLPLAEAILAARQAAPASAGRSGQPACA